MRFGRGFHRGILCGWREVFGGSGKLFRLLRGRRIRRNRGMWCRRLAAEINHFGKGESEANEHGSAEQHGNQVVERRGSPNLWGLVSWTSRKRGSRGQLGCRHGGLSGEGHVEWRDCRNRRRRNGRNRSCGGERNRIEARGEIGNRTALFRLAAQRVANEFAEGVGKRFGNDGIGGRVLRKLRKTLRQGFEKGHTQRPNIGAGSEALGGQFGCVVIVDKTRKLAEGAERL